MRKRKYRVFAADFETTVYKGQTRADVWAAGLCELNYETVTIDGTIEDFYKRIEALNAHCIIYFHNLKFDGSYLLDYFLTTLKLKQAYRKIPGRTELDVEFLENKEMPKSSVKYLISSMGQWYDIVVRTKQGYFIEFRDSLKLLPFTLKQVGQAFKTKHQKLEMEYKGFRYPGCYISDSEKEYIQNDVLVLKEALEIMLASGNDRLTIGSCCMAEYKKHLGKKEYESLFPDLTEIKLDKTVYAADNADEYIRRSYRGGWCYVVKGKEKRQFKNGCTADVNSLYPSVMSSDSMSRYPVGKPTFWSGDYIPDEALQKDRYYFLRIRTRFNIKPGYLPTIQIKGNMNYSPTEYLETSDVYNKYEDKYYSYYYDTHDNITPATVVLTLTCTDWELIKEHYYLSDTVILDGCYFNSRIGIFDSYIEKYRKIKQESKGAKRTLAKLFLNNLYGKLATSTKSSYKVAYVTEEGDKIGFYQVDANDKKSGYIACGSAVTSYARNFTIRAAQKNYHGIDKPGFIYADTDSIHCDLPPSALKNIRVHPTDFCAWKIENEWDVAQYTRQKTYVEHLTVEDGEPLPNPKYLIRCAGMPQKSKDIFIACVTGKYNAEDFTPEENDYIKTHKYEISDFDIGLEVIGKLRPVRIAGGLVLTDTTYKMR